MIVICAQEYKWRRQGARADTCDEPELGSIAPLAPSTQQAGPEGTIVAAARNGEEICRRKLIRRRLSADRAPFSFN